MALNKGLKRICMSCGARFYDLAKHPIVCPSCHTTFTGEIKVKARRGRVAEIEDDGPVAEAEVETEEEAVIEEGDAETVSLEDVEEGGDDDDIEVLDDDIDDLDDDDIDEDIAEDEEDEEEDK